MFGRLGRLVVHNPWKVIAAWLVAAVALVAFAPTIADITNSDTKSFLPSKYESAQAMDLAETEFPQSKDQSTFLVLKRGDGGDFTPADEVKAKEVGDKLGGLKVNRVSKVEFNGVAPNHKISMIKVSLTTKDDMSGTDEELNDSVKELRKQTGPMLNGTDLKYGYTGGPATMVDSEKAFAKSEMLIGVGTIVVILVLMLVIFRSPLAALLPIITVGVVSMVAPPVIALVAKATGLEVDQSLQGILIVVLFGIGTDYILFLFFRYRERLRMGDDKKEAMIIAVERVGEAIVSAAGAVVIAFSAMILASLGMFRAMGPALAIAVVVMAIAGLTLVPAVVSLIGPKVFWPSKSWQSMPQGTTFQKIGNVVGGKPAVSALVSGLVMVALAAGALSFKADYSAIGETPSGTESSRAADDMNSAFPKGMMGPTQVYVKSTDGKPLDQTAVDAFAQSFKGGAKGVAQVSPTDPTAPQPKYAKYSDSGTAAEINLVLDTDPFGLDALGLIDPMRDFADAKAPPNTDVMVGGMSAIFADMRTATDRDMSVIFPVAAILIALVLGLLLRSVVAPWYLMIAVALGYAGTLGAAVLVFQTIQGEPGVMFMLPMMIYMFVVAIGTDYNILMVARLREEAKEGHPPRKAAALAVEHAGPSVAAAGVILAGSFATLLLSSVGMMKQMGFAVAVGVCLSAFVMSMFLVPALTALIGKKAWYPGHGADARVTPDADVDREPQLAGKN